MGKQLNIDSVNSKKANFSNVYTDISPAPYYCSMASVEYQIPENAKPMINFILAEQKSRSKRSITNILDIGCSYGVLAALIKYNLPLGALYKRYEDESQFGKPSDTDKTWFSHFPKREDVDFFGMDISKNAISYATSTGLINSGIYENLEIDHPSIVDLSPIPKQLDLIVSTGCVGYITHKTFSKILHHLDDDQHPLIVSFVLRAFDFMEISKPLEKFGYTTHKIEGKAFKQRKFIDDVEKNEIVSILRHSERHPELQLPEEDGYYYADLFLSHHKDTEPSALSTIL